MTSGQIFAFVTILLTLANVLITFFNMRYGRKKDFQDKLFNLKLDAYREINEAAYQATRRLQINSEPFNRIYDFKNKDEWAKFCEVNLNEQFKESFELQLLTYKHSLILPSIVVDKYHDFTGLCVAFVTMTHHFDTGLIVENQDRLWEMYIDLLNEFRKDLRIEIIDSSLQKRVS